MNKVFYISDLHFYHDNIIRLCKRPFKDVIEMNETIVRNWNKVVEKGDTVYILGDISFGTDIQTDLILSKLNGKKILIKGNHDKHKSFLLEEVRQYLEIYDNNRKVVLFHYPILEWNGFYKGSFHLYGHIHNNVLNMPKNSYNVNCDVLGFIPRTLDELINGDFNI